VGSLQHFKKENRPVGAGDMCLECPVKDNCPYSAEKLYLSPPVVKQWPMSVVCDIEDDPLKYPQVLRDTLKTSAYGRCVYNTDNDVCDTQMVNFQFENGAIANLTMTAFTENVFRQTKITGSHGELEWDGTPFNPIRVYNFLDKKSKFFRPDSVVPNVATRGHGGADFFLIDSFVKAVARKDPSLIRSGGEESLKSHLLVFQAEKSRKQNLVRNVNI